MDLSKSFDTVDHRKLIQILEDIGVTGKPLNLFRTYLSGRTQKVKLKIPNKPLTDKSNNQRTARDIGSLINSEVVSDEIDCVPYSVPQGTVLSPILYNIYVSNLNNLPLQGQLISFADDTALRVVGESWDEVFQKIQSDMVRIKFWFANHNLFLNMDKTKIVPFCMDTRNYPNFTSLKIHEHSCNPNLNIINIPMPNLPDTQCDCAHIEVSSTCRYLGVEIDTHLRWDTHIIGMVKRLRRYSHLFRTLRTFLNLKLLKQFYFALAQSIIEYAICCYGRADPTLLYYLNTAQNSILKIIYRKEILYSTEKLYRELDVLPMHKLFLKNMCSFIHKNKTKYIKHTEHKHQLRSRNLDIKKFKTKKGQKSMEFLGVKLYQNVPEEIRNFALDKLFKLKLRDWLRQNNIEI